APGLLQAPEGGRYVILALGELHLLWLVPAIVASLLFGAWRGLAGRELGLMGAIVLPFLAYVCATGGDWMPLFRFVVPMLPLIALVAAAALEGWMGFGGSRAARRLGWAFAMVSLMAYVSLDLRASWRQQVPHGHPVVRDTLHYLGMSLDIDPAWRDRIVSSYSLVGLTLPGTPVRYAGCMLRNDVAERVLEAGRRLAPPP